MALCEPFFIAKNGVFLYNIIVMNERKLKVYLDTYRLLVICNRKMSLIEWQKHLNFGKSL